MVFLACLSCRGTIHIEECLFTDPFCLFYFACVLFFFSRREGFEESLYVFCGCLVLFGAILKPWTACFEALEVSVGQQSWKPLRFLHRFNGEDVDVVAHDWLLSCNIRRFVGHTCLSRVLDAWWFFSHGHSGLHVVPQPRTVDFATFTINSSSRMLRFQVNSQKLYIGRKHFHARKYFKVLSVRDHHYGYTDTSMP